MDKRWRAAAMAVVLIAAVAAAVISSRSRLMAPNAMATKAEVGKRIPMGTPIAEAKAIMGVHGFKCKEMENQTFADFDPDNKQVTMGPSDILYCDSGDRMTWSILITKRWQVTFRNDAGKVSYIAAGVSLTGL